MGRDVLRGRTRAQRDLLVSAGAAGRRIRARSQDLRHHEREAAVRRIGFRRGNATAMARAIETLFRPSDVAVGPDGALYISDWIDPRVGGHQDLDDSSSGAIYRIAPKGFVSQSADVRCRPRSTGLITALRSPAVNVRAIGFEGLKAKGAEAVNAVAALLNDPNPYMRGRAIFLLYQLGPEGRARAGRARIPAGSGDAHRGVSRDASRRARRRRGGGAARARRRCRRAARGRAVAAR